MGRRCSLSLVEQGKIYAFKKCGKSNREIGKLLNRSHNVVNNFLRLRNAYGSKKSSGRPSKVTPRQRRTIVKELKSGNMSLSSLARQQNPPISKSTVHRVVKKFGNLVYLKRKAAPKLTKKHKEKRLKFAQEVMSWKEDWHRVIFSDEKKFNLDGPDGWQYYWHDLRNDRQIFSKRQAGGGSVMVWAGFGSAGKTDIAFVDNRLNAAGYQQLLEQYFLPQSEHIGGPFFMFQQDNAPVHTAKSTFEWFLDNGVHIIDWPPCSPDLNPVENMWGILARAVYAGGRQYNSTADLKKAISSEWSKIETNCLQKLVATMPNRIYELIQKKGTKISY